MINTIFGTKHSQKQVWNKAGLSIPVTIIKTTPMTITQVKTQKTDGYQAIQVVFGPQKKWRKFSKPIKGHLKKSNIKPSGAKTQKKAPSFLREIRVKNADEHKLGDTIDSTQILKKGDTVNATGTSHGRGFAGVIKRWGFAGGPRTHGQSDRARATGSIGQGTDPGRVHKGKKMPGHYGAKTATVRNLSVFKVDPENQELWVKGQVPGSRNTLIKLKKI